MSEDTLVTVMAFSSNRLQAHLLELLVEVTCLLWQLDVPQAHTGASLINQINGLVGQEAAVGKGVWCGLLSMVCQRDWTMGTSTPRLSGTVIGFSKKHAARKMERSGTVRRAS